MRRGFLAATLAALLAAAGAGAAAGDDVHVRLSVRPGKLGLIRAAVSGTRLEVTVVDARGSGGGWVLTAVPPAVRAGLTVVGETARCGAGSTCTLPGTRLRSPLRISRAGRGMLFSAPPGSGLGTIELVFELGAPPGSVSALSLRLRPAW